MVSQPLDVVALYAAGSNPSRPIALNVGSSVNFRSPAYSVRIRVGERISKRAFPEETAGMRRVCAAPADGKSAPVSVMAADTARTAATLARPRTYLSRRLFAALEVLEVLEVL